MFKRVGRESHPLGRFITRTLGLDIGDKRIGVALSAQGILASPLTIIDRRNEPDDIEAIVTIITQNQVGRIIVGLPLSMDGGIGQQAEKVKAFTEELGHHTEVPIEFRDERLSTVAARRLMQTVRKTVKSRDDAVAAALILQSYLDEAHA